MADFRLSANIIKRSNGQSAVAAASYRSASRFYDERTGITHDYTKKLGVVHSEILAPEQTPQWMFDRAELWNAVEKVERRKDAQLAREIQLSLPHELTDDQRRDLVRGFVQEQFVSHGMIADLAVHHPDRQSDERNHHAHVMLTMRDLTADGLGKKNRDWNNPELLTQWREQWANHQNRTLERFGHDARVDHRSYEEQGIDREPQEHLGQDAHQMEQRGEQTRKGDANREIIERNIKRAENRAQLALLSAEIVRQRREVERYRKTRTDKAQEAGKQHTKTLAERQSEQKQDLRKDLQQQNQVAKATINREIQAIDSRLQNAKLLQKAFRFVFGRTRSDTETRAQLTKSVQAIRTAESYELKRLDKVHKLEKQKAQQRIQRLKTKVNTASDRRHAQLDKKHLKKRREVEKKLFKDRAKPPTPQPANQAKVANDSQAKQQPQSKLQSEFSQKSTQSNDNGRTSSRQSTRQASRPQGRPTGRGGNTPS